MLFDFDDERPDTPRVPAALPQWARAIVSVAGHGLIVLLILFARTHGRAAPAIVVPPPVSRPEVRYVDMRPLVERTRPPRPLVEHSDRDRRAASPQPKPDAASPAPFSRGNTPEKVQGAPDEKPAPQPAAPPAAPPDSAVTTPVAKVLPDLTAQAPPQRPALGAALRDLRRFLQEDNFENARGGATEQEPDISFDSKGVEFGPWLRRFVAHVKRNWFVPQSAYFMKGRVVITFNVHRNGTITDLKIISSSGVPAFDSSSFNALRLSNPLQPLPAEYPLDKAFFTVTFHYNERP